MDLYLTNITALTSVYYFEEFLKKFTYEIDEKNWKYYYGVSFTLACKMCEEYSYSNKIYLEELNFSKKLDLKQFNQLEFTVLSTLNYELFVDREKIKIFTDKYTEKLKLELVMKKILRNSFLFE